MDEIKHQKLQTVNQFNKSQLLNKALQLLLSLSILSFLFSYSSWLSYFDQSFNFYFSAFSFEIFKYSIDRKFMFLVCNVILIILASDCSLISCSPFENDPHDEFGKRNKDDQLSVSELLEMKASAVEMEFVVGSMKSLENIVVGEGRNGFLITQKEGKNDSLITAAGEIVFFTTEEEEEEEEEEEDDDDDDGDEGNGRLSTEELNKKCEDFIRKMKGGSGSKLNYY